ncbi:dihydroorotate dehydrogenase, putative [Plasmodium malariae]|uniref:Dihydroorotate dehydrogenase (quinone), mitochondrial n=1 Tax=Plasmodium malariae TaxID=5858 RepID=A0A1C3L045_PLAMA|nr:dihydroorotate dehydrogenase, putative [Plasmodium malariae]
MLNSCIVTFNRTLRKKEKSYCKMMQNRLCISRLVECKINKLYEMSLWRKSLIGVSSVSKEKMVKSYSNFHADLLLYGENKKYETIFPLQARLHACAALRLNAHSQAGVYPCSYVCVHLHPPPRSNPVTHFIPNLRAFCSMPHNIIKKNEESMGKTTDNPKQSLEEEMKRIKEKMKRERVKHKKVLFFIFSCIFGLYMYFESYNPEFFMYDVFLKFCLKYIDSELCHDLFLLLGKFRLLPYDTSNDSIYALSNIKDLNFINPFGVAAGFDKNGVSIDSILKLGFSFIEIGTMTPKPQKGNEKPRIFRDNETKSIINSCGFNNIGCDKITANLIEFRKRQEKDKILSRHIVGVSIGKNKNTINIIDDLSYCIRKIARYADYIAINVSSPNTPGLRDNQESAKLKNIILSVQGEIDKLERGDKNSEVDTALCITNSISNHNDENKLWINTTKRRPLVFVKLSPDLEENDRKKIAQVLLETDIDGMIISNTTIKNFNIKSFENKKGGVSGQKLKDISTNLIAEMYNYTNKKIPIIASGGIFSAEDALEKIEAGASVCQLYSCLVFNGVKTAVKIKRELNNLLYQRGYYNLEEAIGKRHKRGDQRN